MKKLLAALLLTSLTGLAIAQQSSTMQPWKRWETMNVPSSGARSIIPDKSLVYSINIASLKSMLSAAPDNATTAYTMSLPTPAGNMRYFKIWEEPMMEEGLAVRYPNIKTFSGYAEDNHAVTIKLDYTAFGFHAMVFDGSGTYFIDPYSNTDDGFYNCYYKKDYTRPANNAMQCQVDDHLKELGNSMQLTASGLPKLQFRLNGQDKRTFRLALACTGEYAVAVAGASPTKAAVLSKMVTSMNRVNGVYERELGVHMNLVADEDTLIFVDGSTDPYSNANSGSLISENQTTCNTRIGTANYDIGHVFSTAGGGLALLGRVCKNNKAQGTTGQPNPVGDAFDIDYVAHEMGHQFGADHTFNANTGSCANNGEPTQAYEPGSGSTIMAYAGICGNGNNIQAHSDAYFHAISLLKINSFLTATNGATCAVVSSSGNIPPSVPQFSETYYIPTSTPFELTAPQAIDSDHDTLTYCWEQWNLGDFQKSWTATRLFGPTFRSFPPDTSRTRIFPTISNVVQGITSYLGEKLADTTRSLVFKLTVRDIYNGTGTFNIPDDSIRVEVVKVSASPFTVTSPSSSVNWLGGTSETVTWDVANTDIAPVSCSLVDIWLSDDGGITYPYLVVAGTPNDGAEVITVPNVTTTNQARIKVKGSGNLFFDINDNSFTVTHNASGIKQVSWQNDLKIFPVPASEVLHLTSTNNMKLEITLVNSVGQTLYKSSFLKKLNIPVANWSKGVYYLQMADAVNGEKLIKPIVIN